MLNHNNQLETAYGALNFFDRGKVTWFSITFTDKAVPWEHRRVRQSLRGVIDSQIEQEALHRVKLAYRQAISGRTPVHMNIIPFIENIYIPWMFKEAEQGNPLPTKSNWTVAKAKHDEWCIRKYLIPFIRKSGANWSEINDRFADALVEHMRNRKLSDRTIQVYKGSFNLVFRKAIKEELMDRLPNYPKLQDAEKKHGMRVTSIARATDEMVERLLQVIKEEITNGITPLRRRRATLIFYWVMILLDTGIRPFSKLPLKFEDFTETNRGIKFWRTEKGREYVAIGTHNTREAIQDLKALYIDGGLITPWVLSKLDGTQETELDRDFRRLLEVAGWKEARDLDGRKYESYSIRKWHINKAINEKNEEPHSVALRVGHRYETLIEYYLDPSNVPDERENVCDELDFELN